MSAPRIGVLALHGGVAEHGVALAAVGADPVEVRDGRSLPRLDGLVLPGGETTTVRLLVEREGLRGALRGAIADGLPVFATCAGLIALADRIDGEEEPLLGGLAVSVSRNAYGRQLSSFEAPISVPALGPPPIDGVFIRAPRITGLDEGRVEVLAKHGGDPVLVRQGALLASSFHPELTEDRRIHRLFVEDLVVGRSGAPTPDPFAEGASRVRT